jgi:hypothetical protein
MDKATLFEPRLEEADVEIPGIGTVRVRALSRAEVMQIQNRTDIEAQERLMIAYGMVDPQLTEAEAGKWCKAAPASEIAPVSEKIARLSGVTDDSAKEAYKSLRGKSDA